MRRKMWLFVVVVPVLLAAYVVRRGSTPSPVSGGEVPPSAAAVAPVPAPEPQSVAVPSFAAVKVPRLRPVAPTVATEASTTKQEERTGDWAPQVEAIIADTGNRFRALVGDTLVSEGSMVHGYRVRKVQADGVEFEKDGQIWVQKLN